MIQFFTPDLSNEGHAHALISSMDEFAAGFSENGEGLPEFTKKNLIAELARRENCHLLLGMDDEKTVGFAICFEVFSSFACKPILNIHDFAISPAYQGRGLATVLLKEVETIAKRLGCCKITLEVLEGNVVAKHLYEKYGFAGYELDPAMGKAMFMEMKLS